jgi:hypothetical protein
MSLDSINTPVRSPTGKEYSPPQASLGPILNTTRLEIVNSYGNGINISYQQNGYSGNKFASISNRIGRFPQLFPRITKPPAPTNLSKAFDISFSVAPSSKSIVISRAESDKILIAPSVEAISVSNNKARYNIFKPVNLVYPRANAATVPSNHIVTDNIYNIDSNHLSNAGTNYV